jgi:glycosyltransferase involved in cell wall biosynthesis
MEESRAIKGVSLIICCYNSSKRLSATLMHIASQKLMPSIQWEIIVVDNNSRDETVLVTKQEWAKYSLNIPFTVVTERKQGLSYARKKGVETARYDIVLFCDDDNWLQYNYVEHACISMQEYPSVGIIGGVSNEYTEVEAPWWLADYSSVYAIGKQLPASGYANKRGYIIGAGMVIRKEIFQQLEEVGFKSILSDRKGNELSSGGDSEICLLAMQLGYDLYYDERLQFTHYISANRLEWSYCVEMMTKGFAHPQIYYAMYEACFAATKNNEAVDFENIFRWNMRKQKRNLLNECKGIAAFFGALAAMIYSKPGNDKEIRVKTAINKLRYMQANKKQLSEDFKTILQLSKKIAQLKSIPVKQLPLQQN